VESNFNLVFASASGFLAVPGAMPLVPERCLLGFVGLRAAVLKTARDCLRLNCAGQAKSVRRSRRCCTRDAQVFHRRKPTTIVHEPFIFHGISRQNFLRRENLAQAPWNWP